MTRRSLALALLPLLACAPACTSATPLPPRTPAVELDEATVDPSPEARYRHESVALRPDPKDRDAVTLVQAGHVVTVNEFRKLYADVTRAPDLDALLHRRARRKTAAAVGVSTGLLVAGAGALALYGAAGGPCNASCGKGIVGALAFAGGGLYGLGCLAMKGSRCLEDGNFAVKGSGLHPDEAARFVTRYDAALGKELGLSTIAP